MKAPKKVYKQNFDRRKKQRFPYVSKGFFGAWLVVRQYQDDAIWVDSFAREHDLEVNWVPCQLKPPRKRSR
jgi:hypothetical protein